ncbi:MAG: transglutaminase domain-containing protein [Planctomycetota bacterium]|nr:transglutaminase domain-containing protein [Planctomycetota bacterium]
MAKHQFILTIAALALTVACQAPAPKSTTEKSPCPKLQIPQRTVLYSIDVTVPASEKLGQKVQLWIPQPQNFNGQCVTARKVTVISGIDGKQVSIKETTEKTYGVKMTYVEFSGVDKPVTIRLSALCTRDEISAGNSNLLPVTETAPFLKGNTLVPINEEALTRSRAAIGDKSGEPASRALFDATLKHMAYDKSGQGWGLGNFQHACDIGKGNCTDFHAYYIGMARASKIPARFEIGYSIPADKKKGQIKGYHCWAFTSIDKLWWPVDISEAWKDPAKKESNYGQLSPNRITVSTGRDLVLEPKQSGSPLNYFVFPYGESGGAAITLKYQRQFSTP